MPETVDFYIKAVDLWIEQNSSVVSAGLNSVRSGAEMNPREIAKPFMEVYKRKLGMTFFLLLARKLQPFCNQLFNTAFFLNY
jgi:hypothetical protein